MKIESVAQAFFERVHPCNEFVHIVTEFALLLGSARFVMPQPNNLMLHCFESSLDAVQPSALLRETRLHLVTNKTLRVTPAMEAGISDHVWSMEEIAKLSD